MNNASAPYSEINHTDVLWKVIGRFDNYVGTTNTKAAVVLAFDTFAVSALTLKWRDVVGEFTGYAGAERWVAALLAIATLAAFLSMACAFSAVAPYLRSPKVPGKYHSVLFFEHVGEYATGEDYLEAVRGHGPSSLESEIATQARIIAFGLKAKFRYLRFAIWIIVLGILLPMSLVVITRIVIALFFNS